MTSKINGRVVVRAYNADDELKALLALPRAPPAGRPHAPLRRSDSRRPIVTCRAISLS